MTIVYKKLDENAVLCERAYQTDAGYDICSLGEVTLLPGVPTKCSTGIAIAVPLGYVALVWDKSSVGSRGIKTLGGVIDSGYRGEVIIMLINCTNEPIEIVAGQKIAQLVVQKHESSPLLETDELPIADRGEKGFGSTGK